jgi:dihydroorotase
MRKLSTMEKRPSLVLCNVTLPHGRVADITLDKGVVAHVGASPRSCAKIDCTGLIVMPAAVDMHVHMRGGIQSEKEDWKSGSMSALAGGVTVVVDQPNTIPPIDSPGQFGRRIEDARKNSLCHFAVNSSVTADIPFDAMWKAGAMAFGETFFAPSSYGDAIGSEALTLALKRVHSFGGLATIHAEEIAAGPDIDLTTHDHLRSIEGEVSAVRAVRNLNAAGCRLHFCHLSSSQSILAAQGSVEVTPHHLFLSRDSFDRGDPQGKMNPPLRSENERKTIWKQWDRIDVIASDHAPHTKTEKDQVFGSAPSGVPGVETMVPLLLAEAVEGRISLASIIEKTVCSPSEILGISPAGFTVGNRADFALYKKKAEPIRADMLHSRCGWTPFEGKMAVFPETVIMGGEVVYCGREFFPSGPLWFPGRGYNR